MPLRDIAEFGCWVERESPSVAAERGARWFIAEVGDEPWRSPSVPIEALSSQSGYEVREAALIVEGKTSMVQAWYRHFYATGVVDVIAVANQ